MLHRFPTIHFLGLPLGTTKPTVEDHAPLINKIERKLPATSTFVALAGRVTYINSAIRTIPAYAMCTLKLHATVDDHIDKLSRAALWRGGEMDARGKAHIAWDKCTIPKEKGGLGIKNIRMQNALLMKHLDKFYNRKDIAWVNLIWHKYYSEGQVLHETAAKCSFWCRDIMSYSDHYRGIAKCQVGDGKTVMLWNDVWNGHYLQQELPRLFSYAKNAKVSVAAYAANQATEENFHLLISVDAYNELQILNGLLLQMQQNQPQQQQDQWIYIWGSKTYSTAKFYSIPFIALRPPAPFQWIWKSKCSKKVKVFTWLLFMDRLNTRNILRRKHTPVQGNNYNCAICTNETEETVFHLFFQCPFSVSCWAQLGIEWNTEIEFFEMLQLAKRSFRIPNFMEIFILAARYIWKQRNRMIFDSTPASLQAWWETFHEEVLQVHRTRPTTRDNILSWLDSVQAPMPP